MLCLNYTIVYRHISEDDKIERFAVSSTIEFPLKQWRIQDFPEEGALTPKGGAPTYYLANFSRKLHENEENFGPEGGGERVPRAPP